MKNGRNLSQRLSTPNNWNQPEKMRKTPPRQLQIRLHNWCRNKTRLHNQCKNRYQHQQANEQGELCKKPADIQSLMKRHTTVFETTKNRITTTNNRRRKTRRSKRHESRPKREVPSMTPREVLGLPDLPPTTHELTTIL